MTPIDPAAFRARLEAALTDEPPGAVAAEDLAAGKRLLRRRRTALGAAAATLVVVLGVPAALGFIAIGNGDGDPNPNPPAISPSPRPDVLAPGWRWESYRNATFQVPDSWGYASPVSWCLNPEPAVRRPADVARSVGCGPGLGYGVQFYQEAIYDSVNSPGQLMRGVVDKPGWFGHQVVGDIVVQVFAKSEDEAQRVLDSVRPIQGVDANRCAPTAEISTGRDATPVLNGMGSVESMSICRYDLGVGPDGTEALVQSERQGGDNAARALSALQAAPNAGTVKVACAHPTGGEAVMLLLDGQELWVNWAQDCQPVGILDGNQVRALTADVMHWALSPGWSGVFPVDEVADHDQFAIRSLDDSPNESETDEFEGTWRVRTMATFDTMHADVNEGITTDFFQPEELTLTFTDSTWRAEVPCGHMQGRLRRDGSDLEHRDPVQSDVNSCIKGSDTYDAIVNLSNLMLRTHHWSFAADALQLHSRTWQIVAVLRR